MRANPGAIDATVFTFLEASDGSGAREDGWEEAGDGRVVMLGPVEPPLPAWAAEFEIELPAGATMMWADFVLDDLAQDLIANGDLLSVFPGADIVVSFDLYFDPADQIPIRFLLVPRPDLLMVPGRPDGVAAG